MGNKISSRKTKQQREQTNATRTAVIQMRKDEINQFQSGLMAATVEQIRNGASNEQALITMEHMKKMNELADISRQQLDREGKNLTKSDLIAIIVALEPAQSCHMQALSSYSVADLNSLIRVIVYNPNRYIEKLNESANLAIKNGAKLEIKTTTLVK